ncbi:MAG: 3-hydroxyacyl-CoA dehydrogenase NAD-binding domain-containing protein [Gemmatimonadota bacterium]
MRIRKVGVIGAGSMGSGIAALVASTGIPVVMLDVPGKERRNGPAEAGLERALKAKPPAFMDPSRARLVTTGNVEDHLDRVSDCDWIVEVIIEHTEPKQALFSRLESLRRPGTIISSNTSGIPISTLASGRGDEFRAHFLGTHFFNPPRYLHLLEIIPGPETGVEVVETMRSFAERSLGRGVVIARDEPGFIANRIGLHGLVRAIRLMEQFDLSIDEVDALTGTLIGRPRSATFRTGDITGIDVLSHVCSELTSTTDEDFSLPPWIAALVGAGRTGEKGGAGFYRRKGKAIETLDWKTLEYGPQSNVEMPELASLARLPLAERLPALVRAGGRRAEYLRSLLLDTSLYAAARAPDLAGDIISVDRAMEWGFGWEMGPFRMMDAIGIDAVRSALADRGLSQPPLLGLAQEGFYRHLNSGPRQLTLDGDYGLIEPVPGRIDLDFVARSTGVVAANDSARVLDIGAGVLLLEFRGKMNTLSAGVFAMLSAAAGKIESGSHSALVIGNDDPRAFTAGADLSFVLEQARAGAWSALEDGVREFQGAVTSLRRLPFPVVVAPFGLALGGGCEIILHADLVQAHAELYTGLVEVGVGLIPAGGGTKELLFRFTRELQPYEETDPFEAVKRAFRLITLATTSSSALDARRLGFLEPNARISMNRDTLISDARQRAADLAVDYVPPPSVTIRALGTEALGNLNYAVWAMREAGHISAHDALIGNLVARVLAGGDRPAHDVTEQDILDLECEAFLQLLGTRETQERISHMLATGKPLRN